MHLALVLPGYSDPSVDDLPTGTVLGQDLGSAWDASAHVADALAAHGFAASCVHATDGQVEVVAARPIAGSHEVQHILATVFADDAAAEALITAGVHPGDWVTTESAATAVNVDLVQSAAAAIDERLWDRVIDAWDSGARMRHLAVLLARPPAVDVDEVEPGAAPSLGEMLFD